MAGYGGVAQALNTRVYGNWSAETLVLSHGFGVDQSVWHFVLPYLACFKLVVFDLAFAPTVNHPILYDPEKYSTYDSYAQDLVVLLHQLNVTNATFVGHSMSAMIGSIASLKDPHLFKHLILLNGSPRYLNDKEAGYEGGFERANLDGLLENMRQNYTEWVNNFSPLAVGPNHTEAINEFRESLKRMKPEITLDVAKTVFFGDYRWVLREVKLPCTIIQSKNDLVVPKSVPFYMAKMLGRGDAKVQILNTDGHFPQLSATHMLLRVLKEMLI